MSEPITVKIDTTAPQFSAKDFTRLIHEISDQVDLEFKAERALKAASARFHDVGGGRIIGPRGIEVAQVNVSELTAADALRAVRAVIAGLEAEFPA
jgi:hypothetical protein